MYKYRRPDIKVWFLALVSIVALGFSLACASAGGKGVPHARYMQRVSENSAEPAVSNGVRPEVESMDAQNDRASSDNFDRRAPSDIDPLGLMPSAWPDAIRLHPASKVAYSGKFGTQGYYLVTLISPEHATIPGIQTFHIESFATWESLQVNEEPIEPGSPNNRLTIVAERDGIWVKVISEQGAEGVLNMLDDPGYWENIVGPTPIIVRVFYSPVVPPD
jgi:hypothetical protein